MTLESALPYVSIGCAIGAGAAAAVGPSPGVQRTLKAIALLALAVFAFLRGVGPAALAMAFVLSGLGYATAPRERSLGASVSTVLFALAWLVLAWLCLREGRGLQILAEPIRLGATLLAAVAVAGFAVWAWRGTGDSRRFPIVLAVVLGLLLLAALTLRDGQWPAMAGAAALFAALALGLSQTIRPRLGRAGEILLWLLSYGGQAAMAYVFLR